MNDRDVWRESQGTPSYHHALKMMMMMIMIMICPWIYLFRKYSPAFSTYCTSLSFQLPTTDGSRLFGLYFIVYKTEKKIQTILQDDGQIWPCLFYFSFFLSDWWIYSSFKLPCLHLCLSSIIEKLFHVEQSTLIRVAIGPRGNFWRRDFHRGKKYGGF